MPDATDIANGRAAARFGFGRDLRIIAELSQSDLARHLGVDQSAVVRWESGRSAPRSEVAARYWQLLVALYGGDPASAEESLDGATSANPPVCTDRHRPAALPA